MRCRMCGRPGDLDREGYCLYCTRFQGDKGLIFGDRPGPSGRSDRRGAVSRAEAVQMGTVLPADRREAMRRSHPFLQAAIHEIAREIVSNPREAAQHPMLCFGGDFKHSFYAYNITEGYNDGPGDLGDIRLADAGAFVAWIKNRNAPLPMPQRHSDMTNEECKALRGEQRCTVCEPLVQLRPSQLAEDIATAQRQACEGCGDGFCYEDPDCPGPTPQNHPAP